MALSEFPVATFGTLTWASSVASPVLVWLLLKFDLHRRDYCFIAWLCLETTIWCGSLSAATEVARDIMSVKHHQMLGTAMYEGRSLSEHTILQSSERLRDMHLSS